MGELVNDFIVQFHNLPGVSFTEKHRNLFQLFHQYRVLLSENLEDLKSLTTNLKPTSYLEKVFRIDFLIYFRRTEQLQQELQNGDDITLSKIVKQNWFFQDAFKDLGTDEIVSGVFPTMPYTAKLKILKRLPVSEEQADEIFDALHKRYGIFFATVFLSKCSTRKIRDTLKCKPVKLTLSQLKTIYNKDPKLLYIYLEERTNHEGGPKFMNNNPFFRYLAQNNPEMFLELYNKYQFEVRLGRKTSERFIRSQKNNVLAKLETLIKIFNGRSLVKMLGDDLAVLFFKKNPKKREMYWETLLKYYPKKRRFHLYKTAYDTIHHHKFGENIDAITEKILEIMPDTREREKLAKLKLEKDEDEKYLKYVSSDYCYNEFTEKLSNMTLSERIKYITIVTKCCLLNQDLDMLLKVIELVAVRFKNDDKKIRYEFFSAFGYDNKIFDKLDERYWRFIMEIIATINAKEEWVWNERPIRFKYLEYLINNNRPIRDTLLMYTNWIDQISYESNVWRDVNVYKTVLSELVDLGYFKSADKKAAALYDCNLTYACREYNRKNPQDIIQIYEHPRILQSIKYALENETFMYTHSSYSLGMQYVICRKSSLNALNEVKKLYFKFFKQFGGLWACLWFLKHEPEILLENLATFLDDFFQVCPYNVDKFWRLIKRYSHLEMDKRAAEFCTVKLTKVLDDKKQIVRALSRVVAPDTHLEFVKSLPTSIEVDFSDNESVNLNSIRCETLKTLHLIQSSVDVLSVALNFCKGDCLQFALGPLYSSIYKLPEDKVKLFIENLENEAVKKHAVHFSCLVLDEKTVYTHLETAPLMPALKYLARNPSETLWSMTEKKLVNLDQKDQKLLKSVIAVKIPPQYRSRCLEVVWTILDKAENVQLKKKLFEKASDIQNLPPQFAYKIIESNIFKIKEANDFIAKLFLHVEDPGKIDFFSKILTTFRETFWRGEARREARRKLHKFIQSLFKTYMNEPAPKCPADFSTAFASVFPRTEVFEEFVMIACMKLKCDTPENCGRFLKQLNNELVRAHGTFITSLFADVVNGEVLPLLCKTENEKIAICSSISARKESVDDYLLILALLPKGEPEDAEFFKLYDDISSALEQSADILVQLQYNLYLKSRATEVPKTPECDWGTCCFRC